MLAISVEQQVLTDFVIYRCLSQKFCRNFSELVSSALHSSENIQWKPLCPVMGRKAGLKTLGLVCKKAEKQQLGSVIFV